MISTILGSEAEGVDVPETVRRLASANLPASRATVHRVLHDDKATYAARIGYLQVKRPRPGDLLNELPKKKQCNETDLIVMEGMMDKLTMTNDGLGECYSLTTR